MTWNKSDLELCSVKDFVEYEPIYLAARNLGPWFKFLAQPYMLFEL